MRTFAYFALFLLGLICLVPSAFAKTPLECAKELEGLTFRVALFNSECTDDECTEATARIFRDLAPMVTIEMIGARQIRKGGLVAGKYDAVLIPSGKMNSYPRVLQESGIKAIHDFVKDGGVYVGTCAGGSLAAEEMGELSIAPGVVSRRRFGRGIATLALQAEGSKLLEANPSRVFMRYVNGSSFEIAPDSKAVPLARFMVDSGPFDLLEGEIAAVRVPFGQGATVLISPRPELTGGLETFLINALLKELLERHPSGTGPMEAFSPKNIAGEETEAKYAIVTLQGHAQPLTDAFIGATGLHSIAEVRARVLQTGVAYRQAYLDPEEGTDTFNQMLAMRAQSGGYGATVLPFVPKEVRVRSEAGKRFVLTAKGKAVGASRPEQEIEITQDLFDALFVQSIGRVEKTRLTLPWRNGRKLEIDVYQGELEATGLITMEVEVGSNEELKRLPNFGLDVTHVSGYKNANLAAGRR